MSKGKSSISKAQSYEEIGEFWDTHDLADYWDKTHPVEFEIDIQFGVTWNKELTVNKRPPLKYCKHLMAAGRRFHPPLIVKVIREYRSSPIPHNRWEAVCNYIKERQPEDYQRALESIVNE